MHRRLFMLLVALLVCSAQSAQPDPGLQILTLERERSLGGDALAHYLGSPDPTTATRAALAIGRTKLPAGAPLLAGRLGAADAGLRAMAVYGLGLIGLPVRLGSIVRLAARDRSDAVRFAAADALARIQAAADRDRRPLSRASSGAIFAVLGRQLALDPSALVRARAATSLEVFRTSPFGQPSADALLRAFARDKNQDVRWHAMWAIFRAYAIRVPRAVLRNALHDGNELVRIAAVRAYGRLHNRDAIADLQPLVRDPSWRVGEQALESLRILRGQPPTDHLKEIPAEVSVPPVRVQNYLEIAPLPRPVFNSKPGPPQSVDARLVPQLTPRTAQLMSGPMPGPHPRVRIKTTKGTLVLTLFPEWAPLTVANFLNLTNRGYYDGLRWFRIVPDFVVQTGDPSDNGEGDAGYTIPAEENPLEQRSGVVSMGLNYENDRPLRDSAGTQFYITLSPQLHLNRDFTVFGEVTSGFDVLGRLIESDRMLRVEQIPDA